MSLLEDIFLRDETDEAYSLERIIEGGDEYDNVTNLERDNSDDDSPKEDEAEEEKTRVDPTKPKRVVKHPRFTLNPARLTGPRGIQDIPEHFKNFKFKGKGHEKDDLDIVLKKLEHWAYRLYPRFGFHDCLKKIEVLGKKRPVMVHLHKIRSDQLVTDEPIVQEDNSSADEAPQDEFDILLQQQIEKARATPQHAMPQQSTPRPNTSLTMPKAASSPSISDEQRNRMIKNRKLAEERRLAKLKANSNSSQSNTETTKNIEDIPTNTDINISNDKDEEIRNKNAMIESDENSSSDAETRNINENLPNSNATEKNHKVTSLKKRKVIHSSFYDSSDSDTEDNPPKLTNINSILLSDDSNDYNIQSSGDNSNSVKKGQLKRKNKSKIISSDSEEDIIKSHKQSTTVEIHTNKAIEVNESLNDKRNVLIENNDLIFDALFDSGANSDNNKVNNETNIDSNKITNVEEDIEMKEIE